MRLRSEDEYHLRKSADRKAQIRKAFVPLTGLICAFRSADFLRWCSSSERNLTHNLFFLFPIVFTFIMKGGTQGFPRHEVSDKQEISFRTRFAVYGIFNSSTQNAEDGETSSNKTSCLSLTSCLGDPCVPPFMISQCEWAQKSLSLSWN